MTFPDARAAVAALANGSATLADLREIVSAFPQLRPVVAAYPAADEALLSWLGGLGDPTVDAQLAQRAGTGSSAPTADAGLITGVPGGVVELPVADTVSWFRDEQPTAAYLRSGNQPTALYPPSQPSIHPTPSVQSNHYGAQQPTPYPPQQPDRKRRIWPMLVAIAAALAVIAGVGIAAMNGVFGSSRTSAAPARTPIAAPTRSTSPSPSRATTPSAAASSTPSASSVSAATCWDGTPAENLDGCGVPEGVAGLRYIFPSLEDNLKSPDFQCDLVKYPKHATVTFSYDCRLAGETPESTPQLVRYRYWADTDESMRHYQKVFSEGSSEDFYLDGRLVGTIFRSDGPMGDARRYATAFVTLDGHMCLSVDGSSDALMSEFYTQARFRVPDQFNGYVGPKPAEMAWNG